MSYTVDIWSHAFPRDNAAAWSLRDELLDERDKAYDAGQDRVPASPEMLELHQRLRSQFPCICDDDTGPWSDGPLINNFGAGHAVLGISYSRVAEVLPVLIATATEMGLHVFDGQSERLYRPGGEAVGLEGASVRSVTPPRKWWQFWR